MKNTTINRILTWFEDISGRHLMIKSYGTGSTADISASESVKYPLMWVEVGNSSIEISDNGPMIQNFEFDCYVMDRIDKGNSNYTELISDTNYILSTVITELSKNPSYREFSTAVVSNISMQPVKSAMLDDVNGWMATISFRVPLKYTPCNIPIDNG